MSSPMRKEQVSFWEDYLRDNPDNLLNVYPIRDDSLILLQAKAAKCAFIEGISLILVVIFRHLA